MYPTRCLVYHRRTEDGLSWSGRGPYVVIEQAYFNLMAKGQKPATVTVAWQIEAFLDDTQRTKAPATYQWYKERVNSCVDYFGARGSFKPVLGRSSDRRV